MAISRIIANRYEIRDVVGRGGMGIVYRAFDRVVGRDVAVKTLVDIQGRQEVELFYKEWRVLANLHHPNIVEIFDIGEFDDGTTKPFFVMPLLSGVTLATLFYTPGQALAPERLAGIVSQICRGLQAIHDIGLVHRDLKPGNIFVMEFDSVKLIDFGVAHLVGGGLTSTGLKGTASYMAPEQVLEQECTPAADIFALGVLCYEALAHIRPFRGAEGTEVFEAILHHAPQPLYELNPSISQPVSRVIHKAMAKRPADRYATALEFSDTLQKALRGEPIPFFDPAKIQARIRRAVRAFEQGDCQMAVDILDDLEASGHIDPSLAPLRRQFDDAVRKKTIREILDRARVSFSENEFALTLQSVEKALKLDPGNQEAARLKESVRRESARGQIEESLESARNCLKQFAFSRARQVVQKVLELQPGHPGASELLDEIENRERAYRSARREKEELYSGAREAWNNQEYPAAIRRLERVVQLEAEAPDSDSAGSGANYADFLKLARSAQASVEKCQAEVNTCVAQGQSDRALELCADCMVQQPGHPLPWGMMLAIQARQKQEGLEQIAAAFKAAESEPDLERKLNLLRKAAERFPSEPLFYQWSRPLNDLIELVNRTVARARMHEERGRLAEALDCWQMVRAVYPAYPGLTTEIERVVGLPTARRPLVMKAKAAAGDRDAPPALAAAATVQVPAERKPEVPAGPVARPAPAAWVARLCARAKPLRQAMGIRSRAALRKVESALTGLRTRADSLELSRKNLLIAGLSLLILALAATTGLVRRNWRRPVSSRVLVQQTVAVTIRANSHGAIIRVGEKVEPSEMRLQMLPGKYPITVTAAGYAAYQGELIVKPGGPMTETVPALRPLDTTLHISGLENAKVRLDGHNPEEADSQFVRDLSPGEHTVQVFSGTSDARFKFLIAHGQVPEMRGAEYREVSAIAVSQMAGTLILNTTFALRKIGLDGNASAPSGASSWKTTDLAPGQHTLMAGDGVATSRAVSLQAGTGPAIWIWLYSDRNTGGLRIAAGLDLYRVELDGTPYFNAIRGGDMIISSLAPKKYRVRVSADDFQPLETEVEVRKGNEIRLPVTLLALPRAATLIVRGTIPGTQVSIDKVQVATADTAGNLDYDKVAPGPHTIELSHPLYKSRSYTKSFEKRQRVQLSHEEVQLQSLPTLVTLTVRPPEARLEWRCGAESRTGFPRSTPCGENKVSWTASAEGYKSDTDSANLTPGGSFTREIVLQREAAPARRTQKTCGDSDLAGAGWKLQKGWYTAPKPLPLPCDQHFGQFEFLIQPTAVQLSRLTC
jgi:serine/threonine protein kinase